MSSTARQVLDDDDDSSTITFSITIMDSFIPSSTSNYVVAMPSLFYMFSSSSSCIAVHDPQLTDRVNTRKHRCQR
jgi:hypothetical protein